MLYLSTWPLIASLIPLSLSIILTLQSAPLPNINGGFTIYTTTRTLYTAAKRRTLAGVSVTTTTTSHKTAAAASQLRSTSESPQLVSFKTTADQNERLIPKAPSSSRPNKQPSNHTDPVSSPFVPNWKPKSSSSEMSAHGAAEDQLLNYKKSLKVSEVTKKRRSLISRFLIMSRGW